MNYQLLTGDSRTVLRTLAPKSVHAIITSPPYFNLRSYSGEQDVDWEAFEYAPMPGLPPLSIPAWRGGPVYALPASVHLCCTHVFVLTAPPF